MVGNAAAAVVRAPGETVAERLGAVHNRVHEVARQGIIMGASFILAAIQVSTGLDLRDLDITPQIPDAIIDNSERFDEAAEALANVSSMHYVIDRLPE